MARAPQTASLFEHRIGRLRLWRPESLLSLTSIVFDPNINARCANTGTEGLSWLLRVDGAAKTLETGDAHPSIDGARFSFARESVEPASGCPGFVDPKAPWSLAPVTTAITREGTGFAAATIPSLNVPIFGEDSSVMVLPLRDVVLKVPSMSSPSCIGRWDELFGDDP